MCVMDVIVCSVRVHCTTITTTVTPSITVNISIRTSTRTISTSIIVATISTSITTRIRARMCRAWQSMARTRADKTKLGDQRKACGAPTSCHGHAHVLVHGCAQKHSTTWVHGGNARACIVHVHVHVWMWVHVWM